MDYEFKHVKFEVKDHVAYFTFNEPEKRNPLGYDVSSEIIKACDILDYDDDLRCMVIRGAGGNFSAGGDMLVMKDAVDRAVVTSRPIVRIAGESAQRLLNTRNCLDRRRYCGSRTCACGGMRFFCDR